ncbi:Hypothetical protein NTJ_09266 [Nesidiocoris tenuis]|uniref:Uncharacterized protein n=1 Tax=Nesidiocoris tenuis TaxID=355587 RepID=A0ABN7AW97_9HEMI|nr:Hypothetical protein NTJ_09266 [Nesidiocoris tenuis]
MHRSTEPQCRCSDQATTHPMLASKQCCETETDDYPTAGIRPTYAPLIMKTSLIRMTRGHRNWMTHLPLSRPLDWTECV